MGQLKGLTYVNLTPLDLFSVLDGTGLKLKMSFFSELCRFQGKKSLN